jgi:TRAP-type transport system small permease protein
MKVISICSRIAGYIAAIMLAIITLLTIADICGRLIFNRPITGSVELTEYMLAIVCFFAIAWAALRKRHIEVDLLMSRFPVRIQAVVEVVTTVLSLVISIIMAWQLIMEAIDLQQLDVISTFLGIPKYPFYYVSALGCLLLITVIISNLLGKKINN